MKRNNNSEILEFLQEDSIQKEIGNISLTDEQVAHAFSGLKDLTNLSNEQKLSDFEKYLENNIESSCSFSESFPNFRSFEETKLVIDTIDKSKIVDTLVTSPNIPTPIILLTRGVEWGGGRVSNHPYGPYGWWGF